VLTSENMLKGKEKRLKVPNKTFYWCVNGCGKTVQWTGVKWKSWKCSKCKQIFTKKQMKSVNMRVGVND
jgi:hypothetical protein